MQLVQGWSYQCGGKNARDLGVWFSNFYLLFTLDMMSMVSDVHNRLYFLRMFEAFGFSGTCPHCRNLSQLPSSKATLVVALALSEFFFSNSSGPYFIC